MAEHLTFQKCGAQRSAVHFDEGLIHACRIGMQRIGDQFLAGAAFPENQHRLLRRGKAANGLEDVEHGRCLADQMFVFRVVARSSRFQGPDLIYQHGLGQCSTDREQNLVQVEWLGDVIERAELHGFDRRRAAAEGRDDDHRQFIEPFLLLAQDFHPVASRHGEVEQR